MIVKKRSTVIASILLVVIVLTGCTIRLGHRSSSFGNKRSASFLLLWETKRVSMSLKEGNTIAFDYDLKQEKGTLEASFQNRDGVSLILFEPNTSDTKTVTIEEDGVYNLVIQAKGAKGSYRFEWSIK